MGILSTVLATACLFFGIALGYIGVIWPFFARRLVYHEYESMQNHDAVGVRKTRYCLLALVALGWLLTATVGLALQLAMSADNFMLCGRPFSLGLAFAMFAVPLRFWHRLKPWRS